MFLHKTTMYLDYKKCTLPTVNITCWLHVVSRKRNWVSFLLVMLEHYLHLTFVFKHEVALELGDFNFSFNG